MTDAENTAAQDATDQTTTQPETQQPETFDREYVQKLRDENAKYRTRAKEAAEAAEAAKTAAERAKLDDLERERAEKADLQKQLEQERAERVNAQRQAALTGKVADPAAALKLLDPDAHLTEDGSVNVEALLESFPFMAPKQAGPTPTSGAGGSTPRVMTSDRLKSMDSKEFEELQKRVARGERVTP